MSSFRSLDDACLARILRLLDPDTLLEIALEDPGGRWARVMREHGVWRDAFSRRWRTFELVVDEDNVRRAAFYLGAGLEDFKVVHHVSSSDTIASIAVRHGVNCSEIKSSNNLMSEGALHCRSRIYIPVTDGELLVGRSISLVRDPELQRSLLIVSPEHSEVSLKMRCVEDGATSLDKCECQIICLIQVMSRACSADVETCRYYLLNNRFDLAGAVQEYEDDKAWAEGNNENARYRYTLT